MKNILITGSKGYIGSNLVQHIRSKKDCYIFEATRENGCNFTQEGWVNNIPDRNFDVVINLAQSRRYREFPEGAEDMFVVNIKSNFELLEWGRMHGVKRFVFASTGSVYKQQPRKIMETDPCIPNSLYAASKLCTEHLIRQYTMFFKVVIMRIFGLYGPQQEGKIIPTMIGRVRRSEQIFLAKDKGLFLTPLFISDGIKAINEVVFGTLNARELIFNLTGNDIVSLADIVNQIAGLLNTRPNIQVTQEGPRWLCGDNTLMRTFYQPEISIYSGLEKTLNG